MSPSAGVFADSHSMPTSEIIASGVAMGGISRRIQEAVQGVLAGLEEAGRDATDYVDALVRAAADASDEEIPESARVLVATILDETHQMIAKNQKLKQQLNQSSDHIDALSLELGEAQKKATTDSLTRLGNRAWFDQQLAGEMEEASAEGTKLSVVLMDIDHFKRFNDKYGHLVGDQVLQVVGQALMRSVKGRDTPARYGGEEFAVILPETKLANASTVAEQIRRFIGARQLKNKNTGASFGVITVSLGVAEHRAGDTRETLLRRADAALYLAKQNGRDRTVTQDALDEEQG